MAPGCFTKVVVIALQASLKMRSLSLLAFLSPEISSFISLKIKRRESSVIFLACAAAMYLITAPL